MSEEKSKTPIDEIDAKFFARGRTHGIIQVIVFWVSAILLDLLSMKLRHSRLFNPIFYYSILVSNILVIPIYLSCEKGLTDGERDGNYLGGYVCGSLITFIFVVIFMYSPLSAPIFFSMSPTYLNASYGEMNVTYYLFFFLPPNIIAFILTLIVRAVIKHIENKKRDNNEHRAT